MKIKILTIVFLSIFYLSCSNGNQKINKETEIFQLTLFEVQSKEELQVYENPKTDSKVLFIIEPNSNFTILGRSLKQHATDGSKKYLVRIIQNQNIGWAFPNGIDLNDEKLQQLPILEDTKRCLLITNPISVNIFYNGETYQSPLSVSKSIGNNFELLINYPGYEPIIFKDLEYLSQNNIIFSMQPDISETNIITDPTNSIIFYNGTSYPSNSIIKLENEKQVELTITKDGYETVTITEQRSDLKEYYDINLKKTILVEYKKDLLQAINNKNEKNLKELFKLYNGVDPYTAFYNSTEKGEYYLEASILAYDFAKKGNIESLLFMISNGGPSSFHTIDLARDSFLDRVIVNDNSEALIQLLDAGADFNADKGYLAEIPDFLKCIQNKSYNCLSSLLKYGKNPNFPYYSKGADEYLYEKKYIIFEAFNDKTAFNILLDHGVDLDVVQIIDKYHPVTDNDKDFVKETYKIRKENGDFLVDIKTEYYNR